MNTAICLFGKVSSIDLITNKLKNLIDPNPSCDVFIHSYTEVPSNEFQILKPFDQIIESPPHKGPLSFESLVKSNGLRKSVQVSTGFNYSKFIFCNFEVNLIRPIDLSEVVFKDSIQVDKNYYSSEVGFFNGYPYTKFDSKLFYSTKSCMDNLVPETLDYNIQTGLRSLYRDWEEKFAGYCLSLIARANIEPIEIL